MAVLLHSISGFFHVKNPTKFQSNTIPNTISPDFNGVPKDINNRTRNRVTICSRIKDLEPWVLIDVKGVLPRQRNRGRLLLPVEEGYRSLISSRPLREMRLSRFSSRAMNSLINNQARTIEGVVLCKFTEICT
ncbi:hypothetical protein L2E82_14674 [Cichorium intybus]|uniref:Uncharacterized protein n=1 Tax=Cichorium intybus TaxID=13427 RepID=A0ACB9F024_CICIN|nr:hypothetical protein L2E82_14674 [Cichorium intybus]